MQPGSGEFGVEPPGTTKIGEVRTGGHGTEGGEDGEQEEEGDQAARFGLQPAPTLGDQSGDYPNP